MAIGCLTGNGKQTPIQGTYAYHARGVSDPLDPDLSADAAAGSGPFDFSSGALTSRAPDATVAWRGTSVGETGVDIVLSLEADHFVDRVVIHQPENTRQPRETAPDRSPDPDGIEAVGHVEPSGFSCVEVYAGPSTGPGHRLVGRAGRRGPQVLPAGPVVMSVGVVASEICVRVISYLRDIRLSGLELWGASPEEPVVFPIPADREPLDGPDFKLDKAAGIRIGPSASEDSRFAAKLLSEKLEEAFGQPVPVTQADGGTACVISIGKPDELGADGDLPEGQEAYAVRVERPGVRICANGRKGLVYGAETLLQLLRAGAGAAKPCEIRDEPRLEFRGAHLFLPARDQIDYTKRLIRYLLVPMRLNTIFLELAGAMQFDRRPEIARTWEASNRKAKEGSGPPVPHGSVCGGGSLTKAEVKDLVGYARSYGIEVVPEIQSLSHVQYLTMTYPEIAEQPVSDGYPDSYCPLHPDSHRIVFDMIDEVLELLGPLRYLHMGHDEVYTMAECPRCKGKTRDELFLHDVNAIHDYLADKGVGMMIWADMLQPWQRYSGDNAAESVPRDIVMLEFVWYFRTWADTEDILLRNGFKVIFGNCYSSHFTRYERRTSKDGVIGAQVSVWAGTDEEDMGRLGKLYDLVYSANTAWSSWCQDELRWTFDRRIAQLMPGIRRALRGLPSRVDATSWTARPVDLSAALTGPRRDPAGGLGGYDLSGLPVGEIEVAGLPYRLADGVVAVQGPGARARECPEEAVVPVNAKASALVFAHTCSAMGPISRSIGRRQALGAYEVCYAGGTSETLEVGFGYQVAEWNRRHGEPLGPTFHRHAGYVATYPADPFWQGKTPQGEDVTVYALEWTNTHPDRQIERVRVTASGSETDTALILVALTAVT